MINQTLLVITGDIVIVQTSDETYTDTPENFVLDGGNLPVSFKTINYSKENNLCIVDGVPSDVPAYAENVLKAVSGYVQKKSVRDKQIDAENFEEMSKASKEASEKEEQERIASMTDEEKEAYYIEKAKDDREEAVRNITVEIDGMVFEGNERSQDRMTRAVVSALAVGADLKETTTPWVLADNTVIQATIDQLARALREAGNEQSELWVKPYEG